MIDEFEIEVGGAVITGAEAGDGLPVLFLHAGVCDHRMWHAQMEAVAAAGFHAVAYDRRGYGDTTSPDEPFSHLDDLLAVLDALDIHAAILVGCSMGGGLAVDFALAFPGRTIGLVLVGTSITGASSFVSDLEQPLVMAEEDAEERGDLDMLNKVQAHAWLDGPRSASGRVWGAARELFLEYAEAIGTDLEYQGFSAELASLPAPYVPPGGALLVAHDGPRLAGCVALRPLDRQTCEMKRLYVRPGYRSLGLGRRLVEAVIESARRAGYCEIRLDTLPTMTSAQALYCSLGFVEIPPYNSSYLPGTHFYALRLAA